MGLLNDQEITEGLKNLPKWEKEGIIIQKVYRFDTFMGGIAFVNRVAEKAEQADHHPNIAIQYREIRMALSTHSDGGITQKDLDLAAVIENLSKSD